MNALRAGLILVTGALLVGCASPRELLGWPADVPFTLTEQDLKEIAPVAPVFSQGVSWVKFEKGTVCTNCGDYSDTNGIGQDQIDWRLNQGFLALLAQQIGPSPVFPQTGPKPLTLKVFLVKLDQQSSVGAQAERKSVITSGAVLTTRITLRYELADDTDRLMDSWVVTTTARSNSLAASTRLSENIDAVLKRNLRAFLLRVVADHSPADAPRAMRALAALQSEVDNKRIALAYLVYGATKTVTTTADVIGDGVVAVAQHPEAVSAGLNSSADGMRRVEAASRGSSVEADRDRARRTAEFNARVAAQESDPDSDLNKDRRARQAQQDKDKQSEAERKAKRDDARQAQQNSDDRKAASARTQEAADGAAARKREAEAADADRERERQRVARERERQEELASLERKRKAEEAAAKEKADKERLARDEESRRATYLSALSGSIHLKARSCPDGEGKHYIVGLLPKIKPVAVDCVDVSYTATCGGSLPVASGVIKSFLGASTDCFMGDAATVVPTPTCKPANVRVAVTRVQACSH
jgi:hypothetical protein